MEDDWERSGSDEPVFVPHSLSNFIIDPVNFNDASEFFARWVYVDGDTDAVVFDDVFVEVFSNFTIEPARVAVFNVDVLAFESVCVAANHQNQQNQAEQTHPAAFSKTQ